MYGLWSGYGLSSTKRTTVETAILAALSTGNPYTPVDIAGNAMFLIPYCIVKICFHGQTSCQRNAESNFNDILLFGAVVYVGVPTMERLPSKTFTIVKMAGNSSRLRWSKELSPRLKL